MIYVYNGMLSRIVRALALVKTGRVFPASREGAEEAARYATRVGLNTTIWLVGDPGDFQTWTRLATVARASEGAKRKTVLEVTWEGGKWL